MYDELVRRVVAIERRLDDLPKFEKSPDLASPLLSLPALRGAWVGSVDSGGDWYDISGHGHHLGYNGDPEFNRDGVIPYWDYDGTGDYHDWADDADNSITGTESCVAAGARGLALGGWFKIGSFPGAGSSEFLMGKWSAGQEAYLLFLYDTDDVYFQVRNTGLGSNIAAYVSGLAVNIWYHFVGRFVPSATVSLFVDGEETQNIVNVPASITDTTADFVIGSTSGGGSNYYDGYASSLFLCAARVSDAQVSSVLQQQRGAFGV